MSHALSALPKMNITSSFLFCAACKFPVRSSVLMSPALGENLYIEKCIFPRFVN